MSINASTLETLLRPLFNLSRTFAIPVVSSGLRAPFKAKNYFPAIGEIAFNALYAPSIIVSTITCLDP
jgi:hypothetical protein